MTHPFRPRAITDTRLPYDRHMAGHTPHGRDEPCPNGAIHSITSRGSDVCEDCGGSRFSPAHFSTRAWGTIGDYLRL